jgi:hypothetical protein
MSINDCNDNTFGIFLSEWNKIQNYTTPDIHFDIATWLQTCWERGQTRLVLQAFRASGKSTLIGLFAAWLLWRNPDLRILVLSAESHLAQKMARTIRKIIEKHPLTKKLRPSNPDQWAEDSFTVRRRRVSRDPSVLARGLYANTTGTRADVILCDDVEVPNTCDTVEKRLKLRERLSENEFILVPGGTQIYIGTPHSYYTIYAAQPRTEIGEDDIFLKHYARYFAPILDEKGESTWPERYTAEDIERLRVASGPAKFASQMMLNPANIRDARLDPALLNLYAEELSYEEIQRAMVLKIGARKIVSASAWWDPAFAKAGGASSVVAVVFTDEKGERRLHRMAYITEQLFLPSIAVETNGLGKFLPAILRNVLAARNISCAVLEKHSTKGKDTRILTAFDAVMAARALHVHASVYKTPFLQEMQEWRPESASKRDDGLDAAAGALLLEPMRLPRTYGSSNKLWSAGANGHAAVTDFDIYT